VNHPPRSASRALIAGATMLLVAVLAAGRLAAGETPAASPGPGGSSGPGETRAQLLQRLDGIERALAGIASRRQRRTLSAAISLMVRTDYIRHRLGRVPGRSVPGSFRELTDRLAADLKVLRAGKDPFAGRTGVFLRGYISTIDDNRQSYSVALPRKTFSVRGRRWPLVVVLHARDARAPFRPFQGHPAPSLPGAIVVAPHGRGGSEYRSRGEVDVLAVIEAVLDEYPVDPDRVYLTGTAMGGTGCWQLAVRHPDRFAAVCPVGGRASFPAWSAERWAREGLAGSPLKTLRERLRANTFPVSFAENLLNLPVRAFGVAPDGEALAARIERLGYENVEFAGAGEEGAQVRSDLATRFAWMSRQRRERYPSRVRYRTDRLGYPGAYWARIEAIENLQRSAEVDVRLRSSRETADERAEIVLEARNVAELTLKDLDRLSPDEEITRIVVGNRTIDLSAATERPPAGRTRPGRPGRPGRKGRIRSVRLYQRLARWDADVCRTSGDGPAPRKVTLRKIAGLEGPIEDVFRQPFLIVYGTTSRDTLELRVIREEARRLARRWERRYGVRPRVKPDRALAESDLAAYNLVLLGHQDANLVTKMIGNRLPAFVYPAPAGAGRTPARPTPKTGGGGGHARSVGIQLGRDSAWRGEDLGLALCYPNPAAPGRYVVLLAGTSWRGMYQITTRFGDWFDWAACGNRSWFDFAVFDDRSHGPETMLAVGFFDERWRLASRGQWRGKKDIRASAAPRVLPRFTDLPRDRPTVYLSELFPKTIDTLRGGLAFDRSLGGRELAIGERTYRRGLGAAPGAVLTWNLARRARRFRAEVGVCLEGLAAGDLPERRGSVTLTVRGDGRVLWSRKGVRPGDAPVAVSVSVAGVRTLELRATSAETEARPQWSVAWGEARVEVGR